MTDCELLLFLGIDPATLDPVPQLASRCDFPAERLAARHPCVRCGQPSSAAGIVSTPRHGRRWLDRCMPCLVATTPRGGPSVSLADILTTLRDAAAEAGVTLRIVTDED
ncbi:hypothetical protein [Streptomyces sp. NBC_01022]|uniref:hypothetical protein n=1 Tax=Streptomyces sp. NBC_01022 TaxID=2903723 RepID=UPI002DDC5CFE|nr:hypothetical protein [Streptomyces sp. NBC_01022]WRZ79518.1 hypothetical protein OG316_04175 [Streptomyces sp. NBC_01022]WRZ86157.1 hypothetical protein OG316_40715 [Streptomyces sp. NBC_01022]